MRTDITDNNFIKRKSKSAKEIISKINQKEQKELISELVEHRFLESENRENNLKEKNLIPTRQVIDKMNDCLLCFQTRFDVFEEDNADFLVDLSSKIIIKDKNIFNNQEHWQKLSATLSQIFKETHAIPVLDKPTNECFQL